MKLDRITHDDVTAICVWLERTPAWITLTDAQRIAVTLHMANAYAKAKDHPDLPDYEFSHFSLYFGVLVANYVNLKTQEQTPISVDDAGNGH